MLHPTFRIDPYLEDGSWYFDDPKVGLVHEPLTDGVPELLALICDGEPERCRLLFHDTKIGQPMITLVRDGSYLGSSVYHDPVTKQECLLCPALLRYFSQAPEVMYVWVWVRGM